MSTEGHDSKYTYMINIILPVLKPWSLTGCFDGLTSVVVVVVVTRRFREHAPGHAHLDVRVAF